MMLKRLLSLTVILLGILITGANVHAALPQGLLIIGYDGTAWYPYITEDTGSWKKLKGLADPVSLTWQRKSGQMLLKQNDGGVYLYDLNKALEGHDSLHPVESLSETNNTQLRAFEDGFVMVQLVEGKSRNTEIVGLNKDLETHVLIRQQFSQFHPYRVGDILYYAHVSCRAECSPLIQEIWVKNLVTGQARQLTLLNATSYLHSVDAEKRFAYLSSNAHGYYHIARLDLENGEINWVTQGPVTDSFPNIASDGSLYFVRRTAEGSKIMKLKKQSLEIISLPEDVQKVRYMELN